MRQHFWALGRQAIAERYVLTPRLTSERATYMPVHHGHRMFLLE